MLALKLGRKKGLSINKGKNLIKPFESSQVREIDGEKIVSYGVSSYGQNMVKMVQNMAKMVQNMAKMVQNMAKMVQNMAKMV